MFSKILFLAMLRQQSQAISGQLFGGGPRIQTTTPQQISPTGDLRSTGIFWTT